MKKIISTVLLGILIVATIQGCGVPSAQNADNESIQNQEISTQSSTEISEHEEEATKQQDKDESSEIETDSTGIEEVVAEGSDVISGTWYVGGIVYQRHIIDVHDDNAIESMYSTTMITFNEDGTFVYLKKFNDRGSWSMKEKDGETVFILKTESSFRYDLVNGELVAVDTENSNKKQYIASMLDKNTFILNEYDSLTGKAKANEDPYYFVRENTDSQYIADNKTEINNSSSKGASQSNSPAQQSINSTYQDILDAYTTKMNNAVGGLVQEYQSKAAGISDINRLAEICNDEVSKLAEICNEGVGEMAELMYDNGDPYETYEKWAEKLMENYSDIAMEIQDAYLDSAMY